MTTRRFDHVFVLCTGRCGSTTLARALGHLDNYTSAHESRIAQIGPGRLDYPVGHIEVDNRLAWFLGRLDARFGDKAAYVHLTRNPDAVALSFVKRQHFGIMNAYARQIILRPHADMPDDDPLALTIAHDYIATVTANITAFLRDKTHVFHMALESIGPDFDRFCDWAGATGEMARAQKALSMQHNASKSGRKIPT
jgi:hypothetical protein